MIPYITYPCSFVFFCIFCQVDHYIICNQQIHYCHYISESADPIVATSITAIFLSLINHGWSPTMHLAIHSSRRRRIIDLLFRSSEDPRACRSEDEHRRWSRPGIQQIPKLRHPLEDQDVWRSGSHSARCQHPGKSGAITALYGGSWSRREGS